MDRVHLEKNKVTPLAPAITTEMPDTDPTEDIPAGYQLTTAASVNSAQASRTNT